MEKLSGLARSTLARALSPKRRTAPAVEELVRLCGHLPPALRITAANLADRPQQTIAEHVAELVDRHAAVLR